MTTGQELGLGALVVLAYTMLSAAWNHIRIARRARRHSAKRLEFRPRSRGSAG